MGKTSQPTNPVFIIIQLVALLEAMLSVCSGGASKTAKSTGSVVTRGIQIGVIRDSSKFDVVLTSAASSQKWSEVFQWIKLASFPKSLKITHFKKHLLLYTC